MVIVRRTVIGADERIFCAFVNDTLERGDELFSGTFRRTENWVNIRSRGRSISTTIFEQVGELTLVGFHQQSIDPDAEQVAHEPVVQQLII
ncbi:MAG: hypothetical protein U0103_16635 [Candidatus Obscuribacterales bacterium]